MNPNLPQPNFSASPVSGASAQTAQPSQPYSILNYNNYLNQNSNFGQPTGNVLGTQTYRQPVAAPSNPAQATQTNNNLLNQLTNSAGQVSQAQIQQAQDMYNQLKAQIDAQKGGIQNAYDTGLQNLNAAIQQSQGQAQSQENLLNNNATQGINTANQNYLQLQAQNRGTARAYGGYGSDFEEMQNQAGRSYGNTVAGIQNDLTSRINDIENNKQAMLQQAQAQKSTLAAQLDQGMRQIALDENATDFQKADAIQKIQSDYSSKIASINQSILQFQQQFAIAQQQAAMYASLYGKSASGFDAQSTAQGLLGMSPASPSFVNSGGQVITGSDKTQNAGSFPTISG